MFELLATTDDFLEDRADHEDFDRPTGGCLSFFADWVACEAPLWRSFSLP